MLSTGLTRRHSAVAVRLRLGQRSGARPCFAARCWRLRVPCARRWPQPRAHHLRTQPNASHQRRGCRIHMSRTRVVMLCSAVDRPFLVHPPVRAVSVAPRLSVGRQPSARLSCAKCPQHSALFCCRDVGIRHPFLQAAARLCALFWCPRCSAAPTTRTHTLPVWAVYALLCPLRARSFSVERSRFPARSPPPTHAR